MNKPFHGPTDDDVFRAYMDRGGSNGRHGWNEHQYFSRAMEDLHRSQEDKMAKVSPGLMAVYGCFIIIIVITRLHCRQIEPDGVTWWTFGV